MLGSTMASATFFVEKIFYFEDFMSKIDYSKLF
jgi:hypothetical protein